MRLSRLHAIGAVVLTGAAGCAGEREMTAGQTARIYSEMQPHRTNVVCRPANEHAPGWDYECWYSFLVDGEPRRTNTFVNVDSNSITEESHG